MASTDKDFVNIEDYRNLILQAAMNTDGPWNSSIIITACSKIGIDQGFGKLLFPRGVNDLIDLWYAKLISHLSASPESPSNTSGRIEEALIRVLDYLASHKTNREVAVAQLAPRSLSHTVRKAWEVSDNIWRQIKNQNIDFSYYTKRLSLSYIYLQLLQSFVKDDSLGYAYTRQMISRNIKRFATLGRYKRRLAKLKSCFK